MTIEEASGLRTRLYQNRQRAARPDQHSAPTTLINFATGSDERLATERCHLIYYAIVIDQQDMN